MLGNDQDIYEMDRLGNLEMLMDKVMLKEESSFTLTNNQEED
jgi:hypothetical protein